MATHKVTSADVQKALAQMDAAYEKGENRTDQYVVKEHAPIFEQVSEEEYQKIIEKRREEFVVGRNKMGYDDNGCEIWNDKNAMAERKRLEADHEPSEKAKAKGKQSSIKGTGEALLKAFNVGASAASIEAPAAAALSDNGTKRDLDDMLQRMCGEIEADGTPAMQTSSAQIISGGSTGSRANAKRRNETNSENTRVIKKQTKVKAESGKTVVKTEPVKVKTEPSGVVSGAVLTMKEEPIKNTNVKTQLADEPAKKIKIEGGLTIKKEPTENHSQQLQEWINKEEPAAAAQADVQNNAGLQPKLADDGALWFFFVEAFEDDRASPPKVYLFGKVLVGQQFQSCCLVVENLERCYHLLLNVPDMEDEEAAKEVAMQAEQEIAGMCPGIRKIRTALKWRNYAFEKSLPQGSGYLPFLKLVCDPAGPSLQAGATGQSFSAVFGNQQSLLERLVLTRRIMGPSWLRLHPQSFKTSNVRLSFCAVELRITPASITTPKKEEDRQLLNDGCPTTSPPLRLLTLSMQTTQRSTQHGHEPLAVACTMHPSFSPEAADSDNHLKVGMHSWQAVRRFDSRPLPRDSERVLPLNQIEHFQSEQALFQALLQKINEFDPDVIAGHNAYGFDLDVLASRMSFHKLQFWQKLGRLRRSKERMPRMDGRQTAGFWVGANITNGRLVCDLALQAKDLLPKLSSYDLPNLARNQLGVDSLTEIEPENLVRFYDSATNLVNLTKKTFDNAICIARIVHSLQILPLSKQLTNLAGNTWNMSLQNNRSQRNEMLLCHEFHRAKFVLPDRENALSKKRRLQTDANNASSANFDNADEAADQPSGQAGPRRQKAAYTGGLVLEPKVGLYDEYVMLLDFNSLYPSIIQEHNICFTTVDRPDENEVIKFTNEVELLAHTSLPDGTVDDGILPKVLRRLVSSRQQVKMAMKNERNAKTHQNLDIRQRALKLTANSMYGCLGFQNSRFYAKPLAALITAKGREALQSTISVVTQELSLDVVYGDTDSVFVNTKTTDYNEAMQAAQQIKRSVNKRYKKLEIEIDGVFGRLLLLKKKKYAGLKVLDQAKGIYEREYKGLDIVRRDWCGLAKGMGQAILDQVLSCDGKEDAVNWIHDFMTEKCAEMDGGKVPLEQFVITKGLTKAPQDYPDAKNQAHVQVALRLTARGKAIRAGQEVEYVMCEASSTDGPKESAASRARHLSEFPLDPTLKIDVAWYKSQQVHPLVSRLLGPVEGTDASRIAECLGMDGAKYAQSVVAKTASGGDDGADAYLGTLTADVDAILDRTKRFKTFKSSLPGLSCKNCSKEVSWKQMLQPEIGEATGLNALFRCGHCSSEMQPAQAQNLLDMQLRGLLRSHCEGWVQCTEEAGLAKTRREKSGRNLTSERQILQELEFLENLCTGAVKGYVGEDLRGCRRVAASMRKHAQWLLDANGYNWVDCGKIFSGLLGPM